MRLVVSAFALLCCSLTALRAAEPAVQLPPQARMSYLENEQVKVGVDLNRGGAIVFLSRGGGPNLINNFDLGRQVQLSFFSGPVPFGAGGQQPAGHWKHIGWNPIQAGDDFKNAGRVLDHANDGKILHVTCAPMQWALNNVPGECTFDVWLELDGAAVKARCRLSNARADRTLYGARLQELPAAYANAAFCRVVSYTGGRPFAGEAVAEIPKPAGPHPWAFWHGTEGWSALLNADGFGLGLITPGRIHFTGGFAGTPGQGDTLGNATGYLAGQALEILDADIAFEFRYELVAGSVQEIRARAAVHRSRGLPAWAFAADRQGWHYLNASDTGWPIKGQLDIALDREDPQVVGPFALWQAEEAPYLLLEAAFRTGYSSATVFWQRHGTAAPGDADRVEFPVVPDGEFRRVAVRLADAPSYRGPMMRLRFDPAPSGRTGDWVRVRSLRLSRTAE